MKLVDLVAHILSAESDITNFKFLKDGIITHEILEKYKKELAQCDEFKEASHIGFMEFPVIQDTYGVTKGAVSVNLSENHVFHGYVILNSILAKKVPGGGSISDFMKYGKNNNPIITPVYYNIETFNPVKYIILNFNPETTQDKYSLGEENEIRIKLTEQLNNVLDSPADYEMNSEYVITLRGLFEEVK